MQNEQMKQPMERSTLPSDRWRVSVGVCVKCAEGGKVCVKEVARKRGWRQGCGVLEGELSKNSSGENTHMSLCVLAVLLPGFSAVLHERDWCTSQQGQCAVWLSVSGRVACAHQLPQCVCVCPPHSEMCTVEANGKCTIAFCKYSFIILTINWGRKRKYQCKNVPYM